MKLTVRLHPRSSQTKIEEVSAGLYYVWLSAPPVDGAANEALIRLLAKHFDCAPSRITIISGKKSKNKTVEIK